MEATPTEGVKPLPLAARVEGADAQVLDLTLSRLAADVYAKEGSVMDDWRPVTAAELARAGINAKLFENTVTGFGARLYTDGNGGYVLAFRGTDEGKDWRHNVKQGLGFDDAQYEQAAKLASRISNIFGKDNLVITGHSLGGGLASAASLITGVPAVTYNSAGLHDHTIQTLGLDPVAAKEWANDGHIRRYAVDNEILTGVQERYLLTRALLPDALGHKIDLPDPHPVHGWKKLIPGYDLKHALDMHGRESVIEAQQLAAQGLVTNPAHPANGMFNAAAAGLKGIKPEALGFRSEDEYRNAAGSLAAKAREAGMQRIDHVVIGANGALFAVEGPLQDASHRIASVDKTRAASQSIAASSQQLHSQPQAQLPAQPVEEVQRRAALLP